MSTPEQPLPQQFQVEVPEEVHAGTYADFATLWHTRDTFVLDFAAITQPAHPGQGPDGEDVAVIPTRVVARVRIPPSQVFELMRALESQLSAWESENGRGPRTEP